MDGCKFYEKEETKTLDAYRLNKCHQFMHIYGS